MIVVLVGGRAGEGKSTFAEMCCIELEELELSSAIVPFAKGVKDTAKFMGWDGRKDDKGRVLLQKVGMAGRAYDPDLWANKTIETINNISPAPDFVFVDDWRFPNERDVLAREFGRDKVITIRMVRPKEEHLLLGTPMYDDPSETSLPEPEDYYYDITIDNSVSLDRLHEVSSDVVDAIITLKSAGMIEEVLKEGETVWEPE